LRTADFVSEFLAALKEKSRVYEPREDSFLMLEALAELSLDRKRVLDMGTGSGILAAYCARRGAHVTASDTDFDAIEALKLVAKRLGVSVELVVSDLFSEIDGLFDIIVFNPPYLPSTAMTDRTVDGGERGTEIISRFLKELDRHLVENGSAILLVSSLNDPEDLTKRHPNLVFTIARERPLFFEKLYVLEAKVKKKAPTL
jgi:release factor glutamine methyltransferase